MRSILKSSLVGLTVAAGLGFLSLPARADNTAAVEQTSNQSTAIVGDHNVSVTQNIQIGTVIQRGNGRLKLPKNTGIVRQSVDQATGVVGNGNVVYTENQQITDIRQINKRQNRNKFHKRHK
jgi:hypothetical protein